MKIIKRNFLCWVIAIAIFCIKGLYADVPSQMAYQGKLVDSSGVPLNGNYIITFTIYNGPSPGATALWTETYSGVSPVPYVVVSQGHFSVSLGSVSSLTKSVFQTNLTYLGVKVGSDPEMTPRIQLLTTPYAFQAADSMALGGFAKESFLRSDSENIVSTGQQFTVFPSGAADTPIFRVGTNNVTSILRIQKNGKIGINVGTAYETFEVKGTIKATKFLVQDGNQIRSVEQIWSRPTPEGDIYFLNAKVGINEQYPSYQLDVSGDVRIRSKVLIGTTSTSTEKLTVVGNVKANGFIGSGADLTGISFTSLVANTSLKNLGGSVSTGSATKFLNQQGLWATVNITSGLTTGIFPYFNGTLLTDSKMIQIGGKVGIGITNPSAELHVSGNIKTNTIDILGGADLAEAFDVSGTKPLPGMVMVIDDTKPGFLKLATKPYDNKVIGIVSGANGLNPGVILNKNETLNGTKYPIALAGRVWVKVNKEGGVIKPGDTLTTSSQPGIAMKVKDRGKAAGAVLGKAMSEDRNGMVLILVNLQ